MFSADVYCVKLGIVWFFSNFTIQIFLMHYASQDLHSANLLWTCIVRFWNIQGLTVPLKLNFSNVYVKLQNDINNKPKYTYPGREWDNGHLVELEYHTTYMIWMMPVVCWHSSCYRQSQIRKIGISIIRMQSLTLFLRQF